MLTEEKKSKINIWTGNEAIAEAVRICRPGVVAAYPITPSTPIIKKISNWADTGKMDVQYIAVESEHAAMAGCVGASAGGSRTFTATASQGLLYMMEMVYIAGYSRLPMTMTVVNRSVFGGWNIWVDNQDLYSMRDAGWIQLVAKNNQEAHDLIPLSFKTSENHDVYVPSAVNIDGFVLSHVAGQVEKLDQKAIDDYLPAFDPMFFLDPANPVSFGALTLPDQYQLLRKDHLESMNRARDHLIKNSKDLAEITGRNWGELVEIYGPEHADVGVIVMGTLAEEMEEAVDILNTKGVGSFGVTRVRVFRPFPIKEIQAAAKRYGQIIVIDRGYSIGSDAPLVSEVRSHLYTVRDTTPVKSLVIGIGGAEVPYFALVDEVLKKMKEEM
ncbi:MAG: pyruvate ferredoxin oxidoreductase [Candidatus Heimdallarchaeota archaeon]|nr:pyruvate ferredoxin oxidoreductase [Candidatus Heimdallarchaeota archaeon]